MNEIERLALTAAFIAAVVSAGLAFSLVPHVELVTFVVFAAGVVLGPRNGALVGAVGMPLYVFANSALRGFPPSPLPLLAAQSLGWALVGWTGGLWRGVWLRRAARSWALLALPVIGLVLALITQALMNLVFATLMGDPGGPRLAVFASGMAFGLIDMAVNAGVFALAGPPTVSALSRMARDRGWWVRAVTVGVLMLATAPVSAQDSTAVDAVLGPPARADSIRSVPAPASSYRDPRPLSLRPAPLWNEFSPDRVSILGLAGLLDADVVSGRELSRRATLGVQANVDRWAWGWDRTRVSFAGLPMNGPVHGFATSPDLPLVWSGTWTERRTAAGTRLDLAAPPSPGRDTKSQISLTTGSYRKRSAEFALFRNLGPVDVAVDFEDRTQLGSTLLGEIESSRVWLHVGSAPGTFPRFTAGISMGGQQQTQSTSPGGEMELGARRFYATLSGPLLGGDTRLAVTGRRQRLAMTGREELRMDGGTAQLAWAAPVSGLNLIFEGNLDRRRGVLSEDQSFGGGLVRGQWSHEGTSWTTGLDAQIGHQEPYGTTWEAGAVATRSFSRVALTVGVSHEEDLPALVLGLDRPFPETGLGESLALYETVTQPEARSAVRAEGTGLFGPLTLTLGGWGGRIRGYLVESNPLWTFPSIYAPRTRPGSDANVVGGFGELRIDVSSAFYADGTARIHSRPLEDVPYLSRWIGEGALHFTGLLLHTVDFDIAFGGTLIGPRHSPSGNAYPVTPLGWIRASGQIDNGILTFQIANLADSAAESDLRFDDASTIVAISPRVYSLGLTLYLFD